MVPYFKPEAILVRHSNYTSHKVSGILFLSPEIENTQKSLFFGCLQIGCLIYLFILPLFIFGILPFPSEHASMS